jgi:heterodisulfide reductase subunit C
VLGVFIGIGVTGYAVEALRIAWQRPTGLGAACSPVGLWLSGFFADWSEARSRPVHLALWWAHALLVLGFIAAIPFTRLLHFIAGPLNLFLARPALGELRPVTLEQVEAEGRIGVADIRHFSAQQLLSLDACMECGRCEEACPAFATSKPLSPKRVAQDLKAVMDRLPSGGDGSCNVHQAVTADTLWSCTACSACVAVCPVRVDPLTLILELRRHLVSEGGLSGTPASALRRMQSSANPWGLPASERAQWNQPATFSSS